jgi:peptide/nickel transport system substrate-binding protein
MRVCVPLCSLVLLGACGDNAAEKTPQNFGGTLVVSTSTDAGTLFPPLTYTTTGKQITEQIYDYLADVGPDMNTIGDHGFRAELAEKWEWSPDSLSIVFHIDPRAKWHDGRAVTARDVQFTLALNKNPDLVGGATSELATIDSVSARDSLTPIFWFHARSPTQFLDAAAQTLVLPAHVLDTIAVARLRENAPRPIGTGRFRFRRWDKGSSVELVADAENYRGRAKLDRVIWMIAPDYTTAFTRLVGGMADLFDALRAEDLHEVLRHPNFRVITLPGTDYNFLQFNFRNPSNTKLPHPLFGETSMRRAIALAIDRNALVKSVVDTLGAVGLGPTVRLYPTTDTTITQIAFDSAHANALLDSLGWRRMNGSGVRTKGGRDLSFGILVPSFSRNRAKMAIALQSQLARVGVRANLETVDLQSMVTRLEAHKFDAALGNVHVGASPDGTREAWTASGVGKGGFNYGSYVDPQFDAELDSALRSDSAHARARFTKAYNIINSDNPAVWLYEPKTVIGIDRRFLTSRMRPDAWWMDLGDWYVPADRRIPRDRLMLRR